MTLLAGLLEMAINNRDVAFSCKEHAVSFVNTLILLMNICWTDVHHVYIVDVSITLRYKEKMMN